MSSDSLQSTAVQVRWDLSALFFSPDDPRIDAVWEEMHRRAADFEKKYRGKINCPSLTAEKFVEALREAEAIGSESSKPVQFAQLLFAADSGNAQLGAFFAKQMEMASQLSVKMLFFELELQTADDAVILPLLEDAKLDNYRHYVKQTRLYGKHRLSEPEETILEEMANTGARAWERLFEEITSNHVMQYTNPETGTVESLTPQETLAKLRDADRQVRINAGHAITTGLKELERPLVFTYNTLLQDKAVEDRLRQFATPEQSRHMANELEADVVDMVMELCRKNYTMVARFYELKRQILGLDELTHVDRYAPLFPAEGKVDYESARKMILEAFRSFEPEMANRASEFFEKSWIDAEPRAGKRGGAFCSYNTPDTHPVVFMTYLDKTDDVMTLAHELGHGVHASLSRSQTMCNFFGTLPLAELSSTFGEMLTFEKLTANAILKDKLALYAEKIEGIFATIFRQSAMYRFEQRCHKSRRETGELSPEQFGEIWQEEIQAMFGNSVKLGEEHRCWWSYVSHFISVPFYVYAYSFGELLVLSLYKMAKVEGPSFGPKFIELLRRGGSQSPDELMKFMGVDMNAKSFWQGGFDALEEMMVTFEGLWKEYSAAS